MLYLQPMAQQGYPVYDIAGLGTYQPDILVQPFAPYIHRHHKLHMPHRHSFYHMVYFISGGGYHTIDFQRFEVRPFQLYAMIPGQVHHWDFQGSVDGYVLNFSASFFQSFLLRPDYLEEFAFFRGQVQQAVLDVPPSMRAKVASLFGEMVSLVSSLNALHLDQLRVRALTLFLELATLQERSRLAPLSYNATLLRNFQKLVDQHFAELRLPKDYAALLYITPNHLNAICSDLLGQSAGEVIRDRIVLEAKRLLVNPEFSVAAIADALNFKDNSYFSKFFKKYTGNTPEAFRKTITVAFG
ncbi:helix-turn-helix domain-containing protein [Parapedobacter koreensis]|uniref:Transcriptional regulator, AraC family n=1 Tax=Parapedobacter koreensis TaxID=332977 RepID=A0A1H7GLQ4_9SPHI|nr:helix-turn-helix transcriptional regulator [Parapedobacter koreensis]SEK39048.1 transcriptional regulator, AraC family [Parapedobacter koreensis]